MKGYEQVTKSYGRGQRLAAINCPGCLSDVAALLVEEFPKIFLNKPMLEFAYLEVPDLIESLSLIALSKLVGLPAGPDYFVDLVVERGSLLGHPFLLRHFRFPEQGLKSLAAANSEKPPEKARYVLMGATIAVERLRIKRVNV